ncbi:MAG: hypothetical protein JO316_26345 [Abitibacteriaceae bacterium]|nr:hypothetical protein [Abditibacteriaceae bacterium]
MRMSFGAFAPVRTAWSLAVAGSVGRVGKTRWGVALALAGLVGGAGPGARAADGPTLLKRTVMVELHRFERYWPNPKAKEPQYNTYSWVPLVQFEILGPVPGGSQFVAEFMKADGSPWMSVNLPTEEVGDDIDTVIKMPVPDDSAIEKKGITAIGTFPFKIRLKNEVAGKNEVFFSGKYQVTKYPLPRVPAGDKNKTDFCTVEDWRVPIGFLWLNPKLDENVPALSAQMWFRGTGSNHVMQAVLFKDGKQIDTATGNDEQTLHTPSSDDINNWELWTFTFIKVRGFNKDTSANNWEGTYFLDKNPGDYEIKVLRKDNLARTAKFSVGADGKIVDNGVAAQNKLGGIRLVLPVTVKDTADGKINPLAWKTQAFYGNPLVGFDPTK